VPTYRDLLRAATERLRAAGIESARLDAEVLLAHVFGIDRTELYRRLPEPVEAATEPFWHLIERRAHGEPVAYLTGHREFYGLDFIVTPDTLIPRPETEFLVTWTVERLRSRRDHVRCVDVGTGCGAIVIAIAATLGPAHPALLVGCDRSFAALRVARLNRDRLAPGRVHLVCGDLLNWCRGPLDMVVANRVGGPDGGFGAATNEVVLVTERGPVEALPPRPKRELADAILDRMAVLLAKRR